MENILIAFTADTGGIDDATKKLDELKAHSARLTDELNKISNSTRIDKSSTKTIDDTKKSIESLTEAQKGLKDSISAEVLEKTYKSLQKEITQTRKILLDTLKESRERLKDQETAIEGLDKRYKELKKRIDNTKPGKNQQDLIKQYNQLGAEIKAEVKTLNDFKIEIKDNEQTLKAFDQQVAKSGNVLESFSRSTNKIENKSFSNELRRIKEEMVQLEQAGKNTSQRYEELRDRAIKITSAQENVNKEIKSGTKSIEDLAKAQKDLPKSLPDKVMEKSFRTIRREVEEQIKALRQAGKTGTEEYNTLIEKASELATIEGKVRREIKGLSSDTYAFDTILEGTQLVAGGFSTAQGAMALFGAEGEDVQKMMVKLQGAIALTTGLQQVQNKLQRESNIILGVSKIQSMALTKAETYRRLVQIQGTNATIGATLAQKAFNLVAKANPYVLLATAILSVVGVLYAYMKGTESAAEKQTKLNEIEKIRLEQRERMYSSAKESQDEEIKRLERELAILQKLGSSQFDLSKKQSEINAKRVMYAQQNAQEYDKEISNIDKNKEKILELETALKNLNIAKQMGMKYTAIKIDGEIKKVKVKDEDVRNEIQSSLDRANFELKLGIDAKEGLANAEQQTKEFEANQKKRAIENAKTEAIAVANVRLLEARKGSQEELNARVKLLKEEERVYLQNVDLTNSQRKQKRIETAKAIEEAERQYKSSELENDKYYNEAMIAMSKDGSDEQFAYQLKVQKNILDQQLLEKDLSDQKRLFYEESYLKKVDDMTKQHNASKSKSQLNTEISDINARLNNVELSAQQEYDLRVELADKVAAINENDARLTIKNQEELNARLKEIDSERIRNKQDALSNLIDVEKDANLQILDADRAQAESLLSGLGGNISQRMKARQTLKNYELDAISEEKKALNEKFASGLMSEEDYQSQLTDITIRETDIRSQKRREEIEMAKAFAGEIVSVFQSISDTFTQIEVNRLNQQLQNLQNYYTTDAEEARKNSDLKLVSEKEYANKEKKIKAEIARKEKKQAIASALFSSAQSIARAFSDYPFPYSAIIAAAVGILTIKQVQAIKSQPTGYWKGRRGGKGEMAWVGEQGPELMYVPEGASIIPSRQSKMIADGDTNMARSWNLPPRANPFIQPTPFISKEVIRENLDRDPIDYDKLAGKIGKEMRKNIKMPKQRGDVHVNVDNKGVTVQQDGNITNYRNKKNGVTC